VRLFTRRGYDWTVVCGSDGVARCVSLAGGC
jgi:hypothetical protein